MAKLTVSPKTWSDAIAALGGRKSRKIGHNTELVREGDDVYATLHGNKIVRYGEHEVSVSFAGWATVTTTDRINKLSKAAARIRKGEPVINGQTLADWSAWVREDI